MNAIRMLTVHTSTNSNNHVSSTGASVCTYMNITSNPNPYQSTFFQ